MHPHIRNPYRPPAFAPSEDPAAPIQLPVDLSAAELANELHAQLTRIATGRDLRVLRRQARSGFRAVLRHARARRLDGYRRAPLTVQRTAAVPVARSPGDRRRTAMRRSSLAHSPARRREARHRPIHQGRKS